MIPGLSEWQIDQARRRAVGKRQPVVSATVKRRRLDRVKTNHFVQILHWTLPMALKN